MAPSSASAPAIRDNNRVRQARIEKELRKIAAKNHGLVSPRAVVDFARDPTTALHSKFEWDDGAAAEQWRIEQARHIVRVFVTVLHDDAPPIRAFVSLSDDRHKEGGYRITAQVMTDPERRQQMLDTALSDLQIIQRKYESVKELAGVWAAARAVRRKRAK